jgi:hypothetical protein
MPYPTEERIVWLEDPLQYTYLREGTYGRTRRTGKIRGVPGCRLIGYTEHRKHGRGIVPYRRRFWWLKPYDRDLEPDGVYADHYPAEAVDPGSIQVGTRSRSPEV